MKFLSVALGGALGSVLRYSISLIPTKTTFPILTLITNIIGAFLIGCIAGFAIKNNPSETIVLFLKTGLCGGFTTFSTFSLEACTLFQNGHYVLSILYVVCSCIGSFVATYIGLKLIQHP